MSTNPNRDRSRHPAPNLEHRYYPHPLSIGLLGLAVTLLSSLSLQAIAEEFHTPPICWSAPRIYHPRTEAEWVDGAREAIVIVPGPAQHSSHSPTEWIYSPNGAYAYSRSGTEEPALLIDIERSQPLSLTATDAMAFTDIAWVSEKWMFVRVWFGRIAGLDVLVDVERGEAIAMQPFSDGYIAFQQWQESCQTSTFAGESICQPDCLEQ